MKLQGQAKMLRIYFGEDDKWEGRPLYEAIVHRCRDWISQERRFTGDLKDMVPVL